MNFTQCNDLLRGQHVPASRRTTRIALLIMGTLLGLTMMYHCIAGYMQTDHKMQMLESELRTISMDLIKVMHQLKLSVTNYKIPSAGQAMGSGQVEDVVRKFTDKIHEEMLQNSREMQELRGQLEVLRAVGEGDLVKFKSSRMDFAQESAGGSIHSIGDTAISTGFISYYVGTRSSNAPLRIIQPTNAAGECFGYYGQVGEVVIRLQQRVFIEAISVDHIDVKMSPSGNINSAPKRFNVYGLEVANGLQHFFGSYEYKITGEQRLQTFEIPEALQSKISYAFVLFRFLDNHGHPEYTCVYQTKVHGRADGNRLGNG